MGKSIPERVGRVKLARYVVLSETHRWNGIFGETNQAVEQS